MVRIERIKRREEPIQTTYQFTPLPIYVSLPNDNTSELLYARAYEFINTMPIKYVTTCPHCGQGIWFLIGEVQKLGDKNYIGCPNCGVGIVKTILPLNDPFVNPVDNKIPSIELDPNLIGILDLQHKTVAEKLLDRLGKTTLEMPPKPVLATEDALKPAEPLQTPQKTKTQKKTNEKAEKPPITTTPTPTPPPLSPTTPSPTTTIPPPATPPAPPPPTTPPPESVMPTIVDDDIDDILRQLKEE